MSKNGVSLASLLEGVDIVDVVSASYQLNKGGRYLRAVEHDSLVVDTIKNCFYWNSKSGVEGNAYNWYRQVEGMSHSQAIEALGGQPKKSPKLSSYTTSTPYHKLSVHNLNNWYMSLYTSRRFQYFLDRGLTHETIRKYRLGWNGSRYVIPVWEGKPGQSEVMNVALRKSELSDGSKYISVRGYGKPTVAGKWECRNSEIVYGFAGVIDFLLSTQDGLNSFTVVPGQNIVSTLSDNWPQELFPLTKYLILPWDKNETATAAQLIDKWHKIKGYGTAMIVWWPLDSQKGDYAGFREDLSANDLYKSVIEPQVKGVLW